MGVVLLLVVSLALLGEGSRLLGFSSLCNPGCGKQGFSSIDTESGKTVLVHPWSSDIGLMAIDTFWVKRLLFSDYFSFFFVVSSFVLL